MSVDWKWLIIGILLGYFGVAILAKFQGLFTGMGKTAA